MLADHNKICPLYGYALFYCIFLIISLKIKAAGNSCHNRRLQFCFILQVNAGLLMLDCGYKMTIRITIHPV